MHRAFGVKVGRKAIAKKGPNKHTQKRTATTEIESAGFSEKEQDSQRTATGNSALSVPDSLSSKYKMNGYWKLLNVLTLISIVAVYYVWQTFEVYRQSYEAFSNMPSYAMGLENQPVYLVTTPQIQTESEEERLLQALLGHPMIYAKIEMSAERTERFDGQNTRRNILNEWESFFVADREQDEFIQVDVSRGRTRRVPVAKLTELQISTQVSKVSPGALEKLFYLVGKAAVLDTPEAKALYPSGFLEVNLSDGHANSVEFEQAFEGWRSAKA